MKKITVSAFLIIVALASCKVSKDTSTSSEAKSTTKVNCANVILTYADIKPIIESSCSRCHNTNNKAGYNFLSIESVKKAAQNGQLLGTIKHESGFSKMPAFSAKLDDASIEKIECWISGGMKD